MLRDLVAVPRVLEMVGVRVGCDEVLESKGDYDSKEEEGYRALSPSARGLGPTAAAAHRAHYLRAAHAAHATRGLASAAVRERGGKWEGREGVRALKNEAGGAGMDGRGDRTIVRSEDKCINGAMIWLGERKRARGDMGEGCSEAGSPRAEKGTRLI